MTRPTNEHLEYHAHVYFDSDTLQHASSLCEKAGQMFDVKVGRVHQKLVGPHPRWSCQLTFDHAQFDTLIPWLDTHRDNLSVLVHGLTGHNLEDHTTHASWLGQSVPLNLAVFESDK